MKIRTDFVTNSSSFSSAEIIIENLVLLEILQRYKEMGLFSNIDTPFSVGSYESIYAHNMDLGKLEGKTKTPAFFLFEDPGGSGWSLINDCPASLDEVLDSIIIVISGNDKDLLEQLEGELRQSKEEIKAGYKDVNWIFDICRETEADLEKGDECRWEFTFDPVNGEQYNVEFYESDDD